VQQAAAARPSACRRSAARCYLMLFEGSTGVPGTAVRLPADGGLPAVVHCAAGKDRTGIVVGLLLSALRVSDEDVAADYARINDVLAAVLVRLVRRATAWGTTDSVRRSPGTPGANPGRRRSGWCAEPGSSGCR
jgi:hypothetical protein